MNLKPVNHPPLFLRKDDLVSIVGLSYSTIYRMERAGEFPARVRLSRDRVAWRYSEVVEWANSRERIAEGPTWSGQGLGC